MQRTARAAAVIDVLASLAEVACRYDYVKPRITAGDELAYVDGRHPVVERLLGEPFVANDLAHGRRARRACRSSPAPTWAASPPSCARPRSSC